MYFLYNLVLNNEKSIDEVINALKLIIINLSKIKDNNNELKGYFDEKIKKEKQKEVLLINKEKSKKSVKSIKPKQKGDIDLKNVTYRLSDNRYIGRKQINGIKIVVYGKTQKECYEKLKKAIKQVINGVTVKQAKTKTITLIEYFEKWYKQDKEKFVSIGTKKDILLVKNKLTPLHNMPVNKITKDIIYKYLETLENNRSKEKVILYFKACLKSAVLDEIIKTNPFNNLKTAPRRVITKPAFKYEEQEKILKELKGLDLEPIILIYLITGMRKNEFDFKNIEKQIDFKTSIIKVLNLKGRNLVKRYKYIKLSKQAISLIMNNLDIIHKYNPEQCYREFAKFLKKLKIKGSIVTCRHTFATNCFYLDKAELLISREMGHSKSQITKDIYTSIDYNLSKEKILKLYNNLYNLD